MSLSVTIVAADGSEVQDAATETVIASVNERQVATVRQVAGARQTATTRQVANGRGY
jgi:hypothetical protein